MIFILSCAFCAFLWLKICGVEGVALSFVRPRLHRVDALRDSEQLF